MDHVEQYFEEALAQDKRFSEKWNSVSNAAIDQSDYNNPSNGFNCNICLESVQDPVVTLCGHLYCWPCIYKWLQLKRRSFDDEQKQSQCPVCKAEVSRTTLVPLYGRASNVRPSPNLDIFIPHRPLGPVCGLDPPRPSPSTPLTPQFQRNYPYQPNMYPSSLQSGTTSNLIDPMIGMFGETIYARAFGNSVMSMYSYQNSYHLAGSTSAGFRRHVMQADKSLNRICIFLFCCIMFCLVLF